MHNKCLISKEMFHKETGKISKLAGHSFPVPPKYVFHSVE